MPTRYCYDCCYDIRLRLNDSLRTPPLTNLAPARDTHPPPLPYFGIGSSCSFLDITYSFVFGVFLLLAPAYLCTKRYFFLFLSRLRTFQILGYIL
jgi:hypothetical protein